MGAEVGVLIIHGIGSQKPEFADETIRELSSRIDKSGKDSDKVAWKAIYWADILSESQNRYLRRADRGGELDFKRLRGFLITALGDAGAYQKVPGANTTYEKIHKRVAEGVTSLYTAQLNSQPKPLIILAHSLGGHIISNYIWDMQHPAGNPLNIDGFSPFEKMDKLAGLITFGCNIPLFTFAYEKVHPIRFPGKALTEQQKAKAKWLNFYDPDDILGYPLKPINDEYKQAVSRDIAINVGGILAAWNPASHNGYWTDNDFTKPVAKYIQQFI